jgi:hypothetical protein
MSVTKDLRDLNVLLLENKTQLLSLNITVLNVLQKLLDARHELDEINKKFN